MSVSHIEVYDPRVPPQLGQAPDGGFLRVVARPHDPLTELVAAATLVTLCPMGRVPTSHRERLVAAAMNLPGQGLPSAWYNLADIALRYCRDQAVVRSAPRFDFAALISCAVSAGCPARFGWQDWER